MDKKTRRDRDGYSPILTFLILTLLTTSSTVSFMMWQSNWQDEKMDNYENQMDDADELINKTIEEIENSTKESDDISDNYSVYEGIHEEDISSRP